VPYAKNGAAVSGTIFAGLARVICESRGKAMALKVTDFSVAPWLRESRGRANPV